MARKPVFTEQNVIDATSVLDEQNKTINGTNLRLQIGVGSPKKLMETYNKLVSEGSIKLKSHSELEQLKAQLECQLEDQARIEQLLEQAIDECEVYKMLFIKAESLLYMAPDGSPNPHTALVKSLNEYLKDNEEDIMTTTNKDLQSIYNYLILQEQENENFITQMSMRKC